MAGSNRRVLLVVFCALAVFAFAFLLLRPSGIQSGYFGGVMAGMMGQPVQNTPDYSGIVAAVLMAVAAGSIAWFVVGTEKPAAEIKATRHSGVKAKALNVIKKGLSADSKAALKEVERTGSITQDSVRLRLGWSKAKTSTILTNLDKLNLIQRERMGKTYTVYLSKSFKGR